MQVVGKVILIISFLQSDHPRKSVLVGERHRYETYLINSNLEINPQRRSQLPKCSSLSISDYSMVTDHVQPFNQGLLVLCAACLKIKTIDLLPIVICSRIVANEDSLLLRTVHSLVCFFIYREYVISTTPHKTHVDIVSWCYQCLKNLMKTVTAEGKTILL